MWDDMVACFIAVQITAVACGVGGLGGSPSALFRVRAAAKTQPDFLVEPEWAAEAARFCPCTSMPSEWPGIGAARLMARA
tara:strand:+ start:270 stop:509 length:240 start_codon:yes stop_codon:yes gene_type:complete